MQKESLLFFSFSSGSTFGKAKGTKNLSKSQTKQKKSLWIIRRTIPDGHGYSCDHVTNLLFYYSYISYK